jgi:hypothetical protein
MFVEWYNDKDGPEDNNSMDTNQSGEIYPKDTVSLESLEN